MPKHFAACSCGDIEALCLNKIAHTKSMAQYTPRPIVPYQKPNACNPPVPHHICKVTGALFSSKKSNEDHFTLLEARMDAHVDCHVIGFILTAVL